MLNNHIYQAFNRKNRIVLMILFLIGAGIGLSRTYFCEKVYSSTKVIESPFIKSEILVGILNDLHALVAQNQHAHLKDKLGVSLETAQLLKNIHTVQIEEYEVTRLVVSNRFKLQLQTTTNDYIQIDSLFNGLLNVIRNNPYITKQVDFERKRITDYKIEIRKKIEELEILQTKSVDQIAVTQEIFSYHNDVVDLYKKQGELDSQLEKTQILNIIDNGVFPIQVKASYIKEILLYAFGTAGIWFLIIFLRTAFKTIDQSNK